MLAIGPALEITSILEGSRATAPYPPTHASCVELQRQFLALRRAGALPLQARLERRSLWSCALLAHSELSFVFSLGASLPPFLPNQVTLQLHFRCSHELRTLSETLHILRGKREYGWFCYGIRDTRLSPSKGESVFGVVSTVVVMTKGDLPCLGQHFRMLPFSSWPWIR